MSQARLATRPKNRRDLILTAATDLFHRHGYHAVSLADIGEAVGVSSMAIYRHFASKEDLLIACFDRASAVLDQAIRGIEGGELPELAGALVDSTIANWSLTRVYQQEVRSLSPGSLVRFEAARAAAVAPIIHAVRAANPAIAAIDLRVRFAALAGMLNILCDPAAGTGQRAARRRIVDRAVGLLTMRDAPPSVERPSQAAAPKVPRASSREQILSAAIDRFATYGFAAVSIEDIAGDLGVSGPSIYYHFANRDAMLGAGVRRAGEVMAATIAHQVQTGAGLSGLIGSFIDQLRDHRALFIVFFGHGPALAGGDAEAFRYHASLLYDEWAAALRGERPGLGARDAVESVRVAIGACLKVAEIPAGFDQYDMRDHLAAIVNHLLGRAA